SDPDENAGRGTPRHVAPVLAVPHLRSAPGGLPRGEEAREPNSSVPGPPPHRSRPSPVRVATEPPACERRSRPEAPPGSEPPPRRPAPRRGAGPAPPDRRPAGARAEEPAAVPPLVCRRSATATRQQPFPRMRILATPYGIT